MHCHLLNSINNKSSCALPNRSSSNGINFCFHLKSSQRDRAFLRYFMTVFWYFVPKKLYSNNTTDINFDNYTFLEYAFWQIASRTIIISAMFVNKISTLHMNIMVCTSIYHVYYRRSSNSTEIYPDKCYPKQHYLSI